MIGNSLICYVCEKELVSGGDYCKECDELISTAVEALRIARRVGVPLYGSSSWRKATDHLEHASRHVYRERIKNNPGIIDDGTEDHIAHAICRLVMARALDNER